MWLTDAARSDLGAGALAALRLEARPLLEPSTAPLLLERVIRNARDGWIFEHTKREPGPWLITGWQADACRLRPLLVTVGAPHPELYDGLDRAARLPNKNTRGRAFEAHLAEMVKDFAHPDWPRMVSLARTLSVMPANTFEAVRALARNPVAAIMVLLAARHEDFDAIYRRLEQLPFSWHVVSPRAWLIACKRFLDSLRQREEAILAVGETPELILVHRVRVMLERLQVWHPAPEVIRSVLMRGLGGPPVAPNGDSKAWTVEQTAVFWKSWRYERGALLSRRAEDTWPQANSVRAERATARDVEACYQGQPPFQNDVLASPYEAAWMAVSERTLSEADIIDLRLLRAFDEAWFDRAYADALNRFVQQRIIEQPEYLNV